MRLGVAADNVAESLALRAGLVPEPVVLGAWGLFVSRMLLAGAKLGVFDALAEGPAGAATLAPKLSLSQEGLERLLRALNGAGYLKRDRGIYSLRPVARKWLSRQSKSSMRDAVLFIEERQDWERSRTRARSSAAAPATACLDRLWRYLRGLATFARPAGAGSSAASRRAGQWYASSTSTAGTACTAWVLPQRPACAPGARPAGGRRARPGDVRAGFADKSASGRATCAPG
jgi:hypothetical protein